MPGRPKLMEFTLRMDELGGIDWLCNRLMDSVTMTKIAAELKVSTGMIYSWINLEKEERWIRINDARKILSHTLVDEAKDLVDEATPRDASVVREKVRMRTWMAEKYNREDYGPPKEKSAVQINIGALHLNAMQKAREIEEAEVVEVLPEETKKTGQLSEEN